MISSLQMNTKLDEHLKKNLSFIDTKHCYSVIYDAFMFVASNDDMLMCLSAVNFAEKLNRNFNFSQINRSKLVVDSICKVFGEREEAAFKQVGDILTSYRQQPSKPKAVYMSDKFSKLDIDYIYTLLKQDWDSCIETLRESYFDNRQISAELAIKLLISQNYLQILFSPDFRSYAKFEDYFEADPTLLYLAKSPLTAAAIVLRMRDPVNFIEAAYEGRQPLPDLEPAYHYCAYAKHTTAKNTPTFYEVFFEYYWAAYKYLYPLTDQVRLSQMISFEKPYMLQIMFTATARICAEKNDQFTKLIQNDYMIEAAQALSNPGLIQQYLDDRKLILLLDAIPFSKVPALAINNLTKLVTLEHLMTHEIQSPQFVNRDKRALAADCIVINLFEELQMRLNEANAIEFRKLTQPILETYQIVASKYLIDILTRTDLAEHVWAVLARSCKILQMLVLSRLLMSIYTENDSSKQARNVVCFVLSFVFDNDLWKEFIPHIMTVISQKLTQTSQLHLFMLREVMANVFQKATAKYKERNRKTDYRYQQNDAFELFSTIDGELGDTFWALLTPQMVYDLLASMRFGAFSRTVDYLDDELTNLITQTRNDLLFFINQRKMTQEEVAKFLAHVKQQKQNINIVLLLAILINKSSDAKVQPEIQYVITEGKQSFTEHQTQTLIRQLKQNRNFFCLFLSCPHFFHGGLVKFLSDSSTEMRHLLFEFLSFGYTQLLTMTKSDTDRFAALVFRLIDAVPATYDQLLVLHCFVCAKLFQNTYCPMPVHLHNLICERADDAALLAPCVVMQKVFAEMDDEDGAAVLLRTALNNLKLRVKDTTPEDILNDFQNLVCRIGDFGMIWQFIQRDLVDNYFTEQLL